MTDLKHTMIEEGKKHYWGFLLIYCNELKDFFEELFRKKGHLDILEIGCFKGFLVGWLKENFPRPPYSWNYVGIDIVEPPDRRKDYPHLIMNAEALEFPPNSFDAVIMIEVLEHIIDYTKALYEIYRVLRRGGGLFIQAPMCDDPTAVSDPTHYHVLHPATLTRLLQWIGFTNIKYKKNGNFVVVAYKE